MDHVDPIPSAPHATPSAPHVTPSAPAEVTVALATRAGGLRAHHRCPGRSGDLGHPAPPTVTATPGTRLGAADRPGRAGTEVRVDPTTGLRAPTTVPTLSTVTSETGPLAG